jgi:hypothetical protein
VKYKTIYELQTGRYAGWVIDHLCSSMVAQCQECGSKIDIAHSNSHPYYVKYFCGGIYKETIDLEGVKCWQGECGRAKRQRQLQFSNGEEA